MTILSLFNHYLTSQSLDQTRHAEPNSQKNSTHQLKLNRKERKT